MTEISQTGLPDEQSAPVVRVISSQLAEDIGFRPAEIYDCPGVLEQYVQQTADATCTATLLLSGISCSGCAHTVERGVGALPGLVSGEVNFATHRMRVEWRPEATSLAAIVRRIRSLGYDAAPYDRARGDRDLAAENRVHLCRLGVAGALGMQVMMMAFALYAGDWYGIDARFERLFEWVSLALATIVIAYSGRVFFLGALRDLGNARPGMDVPVSLGLALAYAASVRSTLTAEGPVYYESVVMFVFLLLLARYLQFLARRRSLLKREALSEAMPVTAHLCVGKGETQLVRAEALEPGCRVLIKPGEVVPGDGRILSGHTAVDESFLSGESRLLTRGVGDEVIGGSINAGHPVEVEITAGYAEGRLARILGLIDAGGGSKPAVAGMAERVARGFIAAVLLLSVCVGLYWWLTEPERWLAVTVSVLVVTCPCALSLAVPTAVTASIGSLARRGLFVTTAQALDDLATAERFAFDKTGTLTRGRFALTGTRVLGDEPKERCLAIAAALESQSEHPIARAVIAAAPVGSALAATSVESVPGSGLRGRVEGVGYRLGRPGFVLSGAGEGERGELAGVHQSDEDSLALLAREDGRVLALFRFSDSPREDAAGLIEGLASRGRKLSLYSGDCDPLVQRVAARLGIRDAAGDLSPEAKCERVRTRVAGGERVVMVGDGLNDAPVGSSATVSVAMGVGSPATIRNADVLLASNRLSGLLDGVDLALRTRRVMKQNFAWAVVYNLLAVPVAALGLITPWMAALGMSLSSLAVVGNSLRLSVGGERAERR